MKRVLFAALLCLAPAVAWAQPSGTFDDPANLHVNGPGGFAQSAGGTDWVTLPTFNGLFNVENVDNSGVKVGPWELIVALPNTTGSILDTITKIGTTDVSISPFREVNLTTGSAYDALGVTGSGVPNSVSFTNFNLAYTAVTGNPAPTTWGLYDFTITGANFDLLSKVPENLTLGGNLPAGSIIFAYGAGDDGKEYTTAFTNAGVITPLAATPEPSTFVIASFSALGMIAYAYRHKQRKQRQVPAVA